MCIESWNLLRAQKLAANLDTAYTTTRFSTYEHNLEWH